VILTRLGREVLYHPHTEALVETNSGRVVGLDLQFQGASSPRGKGCDRTPHEGFAQASATPRLADHEIFCESARPAERRARLSVRGSGLIGRVLAQATDALLAAGALDLAVSRIGRQVGPALAT
jgi:hypothetical protein